MRPVSTFFDIQLSNSRLHGVFKYFDSSLLHNFRGVNFLLFLLTKKGVSDILFEVSTT